MLEAGRRLGDFVVVAPLASGGMGAVYRAVQTSLDREAVIKVQLGEVADATTAASRQRFLREARLASRLEHPYAAHVYAFGAEDDGLLWIAMELCRGVPLDALIRQRGALPIAEVALLVQKIADVLADAHRKQIVHRDLKPANVVALGEGAAMFPKLLDFGLATLATDAASQAGLDAAAVGTDRTQMVETQGGVVAGTPLYMPPEQWVGDPIGPAADIYALGELAYEALTGRPPFEGKTLRELKQAHADRPPPPLPAGLPSGVNDVIARALAKKPEDRWASALDFAQALMERSARGARPGPRAKRGPIQYARSGSFQIAYQIVGDGPVTMIGVPPTVSNIETIWEDASAARFLDRLGSMCRFVHFDKRGCGLSDRVAIAQTLEERMDDLRAVMDAEGVERAVLAGVSEGGPMSVLFAATHPRRTLGLVLINTFARMAAAPDYPPGLPLEGLDAFTEKWASGWATEKTLTVRAMAPSRVGDPDYLRFINRFERMSMTPAALRLVMKMNVRIDVRQHLESVRAPTVVIHREDDRVVPLAMGRALAEGIAGARFEVVPGGDHMPWEGDQERTLHAIAAALATAARPEGEPGR